MIKTRIPTRLLLVGLALLALLPGGLLRTSAQGPAPLQAEVSDAIQHDTSPALRDMTFALPSNRLAGEAPNFPLLKRRAASPLPGLDGALQDQPGALNMPSPIANFDGVDNQSTITPPDTQGDIGYDPATGKKYYVQWVNVWFAVWDVTNPVSPVQVYPTRGFAPGNILWQGFGGYCESTNDGDLITLFDPIARRWFMSQFALPNYPNGPFSVCIAVSQSADPTGSWYRYAYVWTNGSGQDVMNDYPKFGVWPDGYYMTVNQFASGTGAWRGAGVAAFERDKMLLGQAAQMIKFDLYAANSNFGGMLPSDLDGNTPPPAGAPNVFAEVDDSSSVGPVDAMRLWNFQLDWTAPAHSTFGLSSQPNLTLPVADFTPICSTCIPQPGTPVQLDTLGDRLMYRLAYRNMGDHESLVVNHTVDAGAGRAGVRWYEVRRTRGDWSIYQQGTYAPADGLYRWMGSVAMDHLGNLALGYSVSSSSVYPSIRYTGRLADDTLGQMTQAETTLIAGSGSETSAYHRWGDYSMMSVDPVDDCTFWYTTEYYPATSVTHWYTRIGSFRFPNCSIQTQGTLTGKVSNATTRQGIAGAVVQASSGPGQPEAGTTNDQGNYSMPLFAGGYTVTASAYGYQPGAFAGISITTGVTTTQNFSLTATPAYIVSGTVTDATTGWPLYAHIAIQGKLFNPLAPANDLWNDPVTGFYSVTLAAGNTYILTVNAWSAGYQPDSPTVGPLMDNSTLNLGLTADASACSAPGYSRFDSADCQPSAGGLVVGNVFDANTLAPLAGAQVANSRGDVATTQVTPDPAVPDSFYTLFAPAGAQTLTATLGGGYAAVVATTNVVQSNTVRQDLSLPAGRLTYTPAGLQAALQMGQSTHLPLTLTNSGGLPVTFTLSEIDRGYGLQLPTFVNVPGSHRAGGSGGIAGMGAPFRYPGGATYYDPNPLRSAPARVLLLFTDNGNGDPLRTILSSYADIGVVSTFNALTVTPTLVDLQPYDVVIVWNDFAFADPVALGNVLADYLDAGGRVILSAFTWHSTSDLGGRLMSEGYSPFTSEGLGSHSSEASLGSRETGHPILLGVATATDRYRNVVSLAPGADLVARWSDGEALIATQGRVVAINSYPGYYYQWSGDVGILWHNAVNYLLAPTDVPWLTEMPVSGTMASLANRLIHVGLDANVLQTAEPGNYYAQLWIQHSTPYVVNNVPVTLTLNAPATWGKLAGQVTGLAVCDAPGAPLANATVLVESSNGLTWTLTTDASGSYKLWLAASNSPLTLTLSHAGYVSQAQAGITVTAQATTTQGFSLRLNAACISQTPSAFDVTLRSGQSATLPLTITGSGAPPLNWSLAIAPATAWLTATPLSGVGLVGSQEVSVTFDTLAAGGPGVYVTQLYISHNAPQPTVVVPVTLTVISYGVALDAPVPAQSGNPGTSVTYTLRVTNTGSTADTLSLAYTGNTWMVQLPVTRTTLGAGVGADVIVTVAIPVTATSGMSDTVQVTASGTGTWASSRLTTTVVSYRVFMPLVMKSSVVNRSPFSSPSVHHFSPIKPKSNLA
jgi:hypothetical protein